MTWANAFDVGQCTVKVLDLADLSVLFIQVMGKGGSATYTDSVLGVVTVAVSADGEASLSADTQVSGGSGRILCVTPATAPATTARVSTITADIGQYGSFAKAYGNTQGAGIALADDVQQGVWTPDPCNLPGAIEFAVSAEVIHA